MLHHDLKLKAGCLDIPHELKMVFWAFVAYNIPNRDFERYIYASEPLLLLFTQESYEHLMMVDYRDQDEERTIRRDLFSFLSGLPLNCLCPTLHNAAQFDIGSNGPYKMLDDYVHSLLDVQSIPDFSGQCYIDIDEWYCGAVLNTCKKCDSVWFTVQEQSSCDYYFVKLTQAEFDTIHSDPSWPNDKWPERLRNWGNFFKNHFLKWEDMYQPKEFDTIHSDPSWLNDKWPERLRNWGNFFKNHFLKWEDMHQPKKPQADNKENLLENFLLNIHP